MVLVDVDIDGTGQDGVGYRQYNKNPGSTNTNFGAYYDYATQTMTEIVNRLPFPNTITPTGTETSIVERRPYFMFGGITIPQGSTIQDATLTFSIRISNGPLTFTGKVFGRKTATPEPYGTVASGTGVFTKTNATAFGTFAVSGAPTSTTFTQKQSDITATVQELVNAFDYNDDVMMFTLTGATLPPIPTTTTTLTFTTSQSAYINQEGSANVPNLTINYTGPECTPQDVELIGSLLNRDTQEITTVSKKVGQRRTFTQQEVDTIGAGFSKIQYWIKGKKDATVQASVWSSAVVGTSIETVEATTDEITADSNVNQFVLITQTFLDSTGTFAKAWKPAVGVEYVIGMEMTAVTNQTETGTVSSDVITGNLTERDLGGNWTDTVGEDWSVGAIYTIPCTGKDEFGVDALLLADPTAFFNVDAILDDLATPHINALDIDAILDDITGPELTHTFSIDALLKALGANGTCALPATEVIYSETTTSQALGDRIGGRFGGELEKMTRTGFEVVGPTLVGKTIEDFQVRNIRQNNNPPVSGFIFVTIRQADDRIISQSNSVNVNTLPTFGTPQNRLFTFPEPVTLEEGYKIQLEFPNCGGCQTANNIFFGPNVVWFGTTGDPPTGLKRVIFFGNEYQFPTNQRNSGIMSSTVSLATQQAQNACFGVGAFLKRIDGSCLFTLTDDMSDASKWVATDITDPEFPNNGFARIAGGVIEFHAATDNTNDAIATDLMEELGTFLDTDGRWRMRFKFEAVDIAVGSPNNFFYFGLSQTNQDDNIGVGIGDGYGFRYGISASVEEIRAYTKDGQTQITHGVLETMATGNIKFCELIRNSNTSMTWNIYSDAGFTTLTSTITATIPSGVRDSLMAFAKGTNHLFSSSGGTLEGEFDDLEILQEGQNGAGCIEIDSRIALRAMEGFTVDAELQAMEEFTIDALLVVPVDVTFLNLTIPEPPVAPTETFLIDSILVGTKENFLVDGLTFILPSKLITIDAILQAEFTTVFDVDAILKATQMEVFTIDAILPAFGLIFNFTVDGLPVGESPKEFFVDSIIDDIKQKFFTVDAILRAEFTETFLVDGITFTFPSELITVDAIIFIIPVVDKTFEVDALLKSSGVCLGQSKVFFDDISSNAGWTQTGTQITADDVSFPGLIRAECVVNGATKQQVVKSLGFNMSLKTDMVWDFDYRAFNPCTFPLGGNGNLFIQLSELSDRTNDTPIQAYIQCRIFKSFSNQFQIGSFVRSNTGGVLTTTSFLSGAGKPKTFFIRVSITGNGTSFTLQVFDDSARTVLVFSDTKDMSALSDDPLNFVQISNLGGQTQPNNQLRGEVDNISIDADACPNFLVDSIITVIASTEFFDIDAILTVPNSTFDVDGLILLIPGELFTLDAIIDDIKQNQFTIDALIKSQGANGCGAVFFDTINDATPWTVVGGGQIVVNDTAGIIEWNGLQGGATTNERFAFRTIPNFADDIGEIRIRVKVDKISDSSPTAPTGRFMVLQNNALHPNPSTGSHLQIFIGSGQTNGGIAASVSDGTIGVNTTPQLNFANGTTKFLEAVYDPVGKTLTMNVYTDSLFTVHDTGSPVQIDASTVSMTGLTFTHMITSNVKNSGPARVVTADLDDFTIGFGCPAFAIDSILTDQPFIVFSIDAILIAEQIETFEVDAILDDPAVVLENFTVDSCIRQERITTFEVDAIPDAVGNKICGLDLTDLKAYWNFDETSGVLVNQAGSIGSVDTLGTAADGTVGSLIDRNLAGQVGTSYEFEGLTETQAGNKITIGSSNSQFNFMHTPGSVGTFNFWINPRDNSQVFADLFVNENNQSTNTGMSIGIALGKIVVRPRAPSTELLSTVQTTTLLNPNVFNMVTVVWDETTGADIYFDGVFLETFPRAVNTASSGNANFPLTIATRSQTQAGVTFDGFLDEASAWGRKLTPSEINELYAINNNGDPLAQKGEAKCFTVDARLVQTQTKDFTIDAILLLQLVTNTENFLIDGLLAIMPSRMYCVDAVLQAFGITEIFEVDALLDIPGAITKDFTVNAILKRFGDVLCGGLTGLVFQDDFTTNTGWLNNGGTNIQIDTVTFPNALQLSNLLSTTHAPGFRRAVKPLTTPFSPNDDFVWEFKHVHDTSGGGGFASEFVIELKETVNNTSVSPTETTIRYRTDVVISTGINDPEDIRLEVADNNGNNFVLSPQSALRLVIATGFIYYPRITKTGNIIKLEIFTDAGRTILASVGNGLLVGNGVVQVDTTGFDFSQNLAQIYVGNYSTGGAARVINEQIDDILIFSSVCPSPRIDSLIKVLGDNASCSELQTIVSSRGEQDDTFSPGISGTTQNGEGMAIRFTPKTSFRLKNIEWNSTKGTGFQSGAVRAKLYLGSTIPTSGVFNPFFSTLVSNADFWSSGSPNAEAQFITFWNVGSQLRRTTFDGKGTNDGILLQAGVQYLVVWQENDVGTGWTLSTTTIPNGNSSTDGSNPLTDKFIGAVEGTEHWNATGSGSNPLQVIPITGEEFAFNMNVNAPTNAGCISVDGCLLLQKTLGFSVDAIITPLFMVEEFDVNAIVNFHKSFIVDVSITPDTGFVRDIGDVIVRVLFENDDLGGAGLTGRQVVEEVVKITTVELQWGFRGKTSRIRSWLNTLKFRGVVQEDGSDPDWYETIWTLV